MRTYRLFFRDPVNGHIVERRSFEAQGDLAAIQTAATLGDGRPMDLRDTRRAVKSWTAEQARHLSNTLSEGPMTEMPDTDATPKPDRDPEQEKVIEVKKDSQKRSDAGELDTDETEQIKQFREDAQELIDGGQLDPVDAEALLDLSVHRVEPS